MQLLEARDAVAELLGELPRQVHDMLEHVSCQVLDRPPSTEPPDTKAMFVGRQQLGAPEDGDDDDEIEPAHGTILLFSENLAGWVQAQMAVMHEIAHALGLDENDVAELGLA